DPLEGWMEELYRRVSDRQTMGSVVQELRASLSEAEKLIDQFFRNPSDRTVLIPVPNQLSAMRGVLSVLGMDQAAAALLRMRDEVDGMVSTEIDPQRVAQAGVFDRLAGNLGALGFLIDMLSVQPQMAKSLFSYDAEAGTLSPVMGRGEAHAPAATRPPTAAAPVDQRLIEQAQLLAFSSVREDVPVAEVSRDLERLSHEAQAADQPALAATVLRAQEALEQAFDSPADAAAVRSELSEALVDFVSTASDPVGLDPEVRPSPRGTVSAPMTLDFAPSTGSAQLAQDNEMREIFLEEAREVLGHARDASAALADAPDDLNLLTTLRRAFHTLKGSSRMVGLKDFGEGAWACEQLYNTQLAEQTVVPPALREFTDWSLGYLTSWVDDIAAQRHGSHDAATVIEAAKLAGGVPPVPLVLESASVHGALALPPDLPSAADLDLAPAVPAPADGELPALSFELDLAGLDAPASSEHAPLDLTPTEAHEPFEALPVPDTIEGAFADPIDVDLDLDLDLSGAHAAPAAPEPLTEPASEHGGLDDELVKVVGPLRIGIPLFNIYLNEADELSRRLCTELAEWAMELYRPIGETPIALAHSLAGSSATVGFADLSQLARLLEHAQARSLAIGHGTPEEARLFVDAADEIRRLLHQFAAGFLKEPAPELLARLAEHELSSARRLEAAAAAAELPPVSEPGALAGRPQAAPEPAPPWLEPAADDAPPQRFETSVTSPSDSIFGRESGFQPLGVAELKPFGEIPVEAPRAASAVHALVDADDAIDAVDAVDAELFPIFAEEAEELLPQLASRLRDWARRPGDAALPSACMRTL
ncbi:MAG TPA: Hpt domain-containing protein, partial [Burkholderiaceae bacterium]|nr:Hpt domain-containing protein [Burkholderiaceae bacterium]